MAGEVKDQHIFTFSRQSNKYADLVFLILVKKVSITFLKNSAIAPV